MFVNISSHPSSQWSEAQLNAANDQITALPQDLQARFSAVNPKQPVAALGFDILRYCDQCQVSALSQPTAMVQGESRLTTWLVRRLVDRGWRVVAGTTERISSEVIQPDGSLKKTQIFQFAAFMPYEL